MSTKQFTLKDEQETVALGTELAQLCSQQTTIYLHGDLGAGKTTSVVVLSVLLGIKET